jgi:CheY-like chemotaxis protein
MDKKYIVIVDDDESAMSLAAWLFIEKGERVAAFTNGTEAMLFLKRFAGRIKCVLLDLSLPVLDGLTIAEQIRLNEATFEEAEPVPIAFYTAHHQQANGATERVAERCNVEKIFHKPEDTDDLPEKVAEWLKNRNEGEVVKINAV